MQVSKALLLDFFIKASEAGEEVARVHAILKYQEEHAVRLNLSFSMEERKTKEMYYWTI